ncbi:MAG: acyl carrier protein [Erysipelotrichaceae bacterium]|nr:acyl carrier protein [Erysipelotrichaceae bacterium]
MREEILEILDEINEDISSYEGDNLLQDGLIDSLSIIDLVAELCDTFDINISAKYIIEDNFKSVDAIVALVESLKEE